MTTNSTEQNMKGKEAKKRKLIDKENEKEEKEIEVTSLPLLTSPGAPTQTGEVQPLIRGDIQSRGHIAHSIIIKLFFFSFFLSI